MWLLDWILKVKNYWEHGTIPQIPAAFFTLVRWDFENIFKVFRFPWWTKMENAVPKHFFPKT